MIADVLVEIKAEGIDKTFSYIIPDNLLDKVKVGIRVIVPFGKQKLEGFVLNIKDYYETEYSLKEIIDIVDEEPVLNEEMLKLGNYISKKTICNLISAYQTMLPKALKAKHDVVVNKKYVSYLKLDRSKLELVTSEKQKEIINMFKDEYVLKSEVSKISVYLVNKMIEKGILIEEKKEVYRLNNDANIVTKKVNLTSEQDNAVKEVLSSLGTFKSFLIHGVTGSGKTEVYMNIIEKVLCDKKEALVLVPEISLTPQLINIFKSRFGSSIAVLHSKLSDGERYDEWRKIIKKEVSIVIGARSAIFAPLTNIGVIIIDEEHTDTYKQDNNPRYDAKDIAIYRAKYHNCPVVFGSATPSIESYTRAKLGVYTLINMPTRVNNNLPDVHLVDMKDEYRKGNRYFSELLVNSINEKLARNEQIIILLNRRGFSTVITCHNCGYTEKCPKCDIPLTYHKSSNTMRCHYCGYGKAKIIKCPQCNSMDINEFGMGTQKLEEEINNMFPNARVVRMDIDTTSRKGAHEKIINDFKEEKFNILIGTQMIAKGLDFPKVTLVGVINGDASLNIPDFRSAERTFDLLNQVAGRAGRSSSKGMVIIQGLNINHYSIIKASIHDYVGFYEEEIAIRKKIGYPPFNNLCLIKIKCSDYNMVIDEAKKIGIYLRDNIKELVLGPSMSSIPKINNIYSMQILIKYKKTENIYDALLYVKDRYKKNNKVNVEIDINPLRI